MIYSMVIVVSVSWLHLAQEKQVDSSWIDAIRADVVAFVSDDLNLSRKAEARLEDRLVDIQSLFRNDGYDRGWLDSGLIQKIASKLNTHTESPRTIYCALGLLSLCSSIEEPVVESICDILNSPECHIGIRTCAFKTLCDILQTDDSVIRKVEAMWLTFDLNTHSALFEMFTDKDMLFRFQGLEMVADDLVTHIQATKREAMEISAVVERLEQSDLRIEKLFCLQFLLLVSDHSDLFLENVQVFQTDNDPDIRLLATMLLLVSSSDPLEIDRIVNQANLSEAQKSLLRTRLAAKPR